MILQIIWSYWLPATISLVASLALLCWFYLQRLQEEDMADLRRGAQRTQDQTLQFSTAKGELVPWPPRGATGGSGVSHEAGAGDGYSLSTVRAGPTPGNRGM